MENYQIFISYRRDGGDALAGRIADQLRNLGYKVFFDVETMRSGSFNKQIFNAIDTCTDVLVILPPHALNRCRKKEDWVRQEVAYALKQKKNVIPIMMRGFRFPIFLPNDIASLKYMQGIAASSEYFDAAIQKLEQLLTCKAADNPVKSNSDDISAEKLMQGVFLGFKLARMEFIWGSKFDFAKVAFEDGLRELKLFLDSDNVPYVEHNYQQFCNSIINFYRLHDSQKLYSILIGMFIQRETLSHSVKEESSQAELHKLAISALSTIPSSYIKNKDLFIHFVAQQIATETALGEIVDNIHSFINSR